jgi:hypothetical protein
MIFSFEDCLAFFLASLLEFKDAWCSVGLVSWGDVPGEASAESVPSLSGEPVWRCRLLDFDMQRHYPQLVKTSLEDEGIWYAGTQP